MKEDPKRTDASAASDAPPEDDGSTTQAIHPVEAEVVWPHQAIPQVEAAAVKQMKPLTAIRPVAVVAAVSCLIVLFLKFVPRVRLPPHPGFFVGSEDRRSNRGARLSRASIASPSQQSNHGDEQGRADDRPDDGESCGSNLKIE